MLVCVLLNLYAHVHERLGKNSLRETTRYCSELGQSEVLHKKEKMGTIKAQNVHVWECHSEIHKIVPLIC